MSDEPPRVRLSELEAIAAQWEQQGNADGDAENEAFKNGDRAEVDRLGDLAATKWRLAEELRVLVATHFEVGMRVTYFTEGQQHTGTLSRVPVPSLPSWLVDRDDGGCDSVPSTSIRYLGESSGSNIPVRKG